ncbi:MAG TPA: DUF4861 family protein [Acidisarcina sp.]
MARLDRATLYLRVRHSLLLFLPAVIGGVEAGASARHRGGASTVQLVVMNPVGVSRPEELVTIPLAEVAANTGIGDPRRVRVVDVSTQKELPTQVEATVEGHPADRLLVLVSLGAERSVQLRFHAGESAAAAPLVYGRAVPERKDDFAWENDKVAYRVYGAALEAGGEVSSGIDVWSKRTARLIVNDWYARDAEGQRTKNPALSYHRDNGDGLDSYDVGSTRGCGGTGVWADGKLYVSRNYTSVEVLEPGPLRLRFRLQYAAWRAGEQTITEEKLITLDAGSHMNRIESSFHFAGARSAQVALGLGLHSGSASIPVGEGVLAVWEPLTNPAAGMDGTAILLPPGTTSSQVDAAGNRLLLVTAQSGVPVIYFAGAGWSKSDMPDTDAWAAYLREYRMRLEHPLKLRWVKVRD